MTWSLSNENPHRQEDMNIAGTYHVRVVDVLSEYPNILSDNLLTQDRCV